MGTWGVAIFQDDTAEDVRSEYRALLEDGLSGRAATRRLVEQNAFWLGDPDDEDYGVFWLALAATQCRLGRLEPGVRRKALKVIDSGSDLKRRREDEKGRQSAARERVLLKLRRELLGPQREPVKIRRPYREWADWNVGHAIAYRLPSGRWAILRVIQIMQSKRERYAIVEVCKWTGTEIPDKRAIEKLKPVKRRSNLWIGNPWKRLKFALFAMAARDFPADRVCVAATRVRVGRETDICGTRYAGGWKGLDAFLKEDCGIE